MSPAAKPTASSGSGLRGKTVPLSKDHWRDLADLARDLQDARTRKTERITENTIIRIAIDLITAHPELLHGDTEEEIRVGALERLNAWRAAATTAAGED
ncbi:hypothetical protein K388_07352 [Streptomyces sp. KhCrAH-43]|uniref:hypothetical protein n=1 Tax=unclassified Streptomyces TaxID=2593676 RepID=UPI000363A39C|nr:MULTISPECIES: hypothetical protein [unclassified Streptomyces]MYS37583.1 hypothetical protein [Streptomyces sp. SID4920]MYX67191.1 hypothetical protein [Streptomyces sp. SID8373]RAJ44940.1 hypothetical protein K388_07352 [Streptomyces sp. KhCrAH-43]